MGRNIYFQFKEFLIVQQEAAMKVGTDGVLLGAWVNTGSAKTILDVGSGTGVIALMMAQRSEAEITGIEIEKMAATEAMGNARNSPWSNRVTILNNSFQDYVQNQPSSFDLIISNPPFFSNSKKSQSELLAIAKHNHLLSHADLIHCSAQILNPEGRLAVILPADSATCYKELAVKTQLYLLRETIVRPNTQKKPHRALLEFGKASQSHIDTDEVCIHKDDCSDFTEQYKALTGKFYLNF